MSLDDRILFIATPGGKTHTIAHDILNERRAAIKARREYSKSKGDDCLGLFGCDRAIGALIYKAGKIPQGWVRCAKLHRKHCPPEGGVFVIPDYKKRDTHRALNDELMALPSLPSSADFTDRIGSSWVMRGMALHYCYFEFIGEQLIVFIPKNLTPKETLEEHGESEPNKPQFVPPDSTPLKHSEFYAMKEAEEAKRAAESSAVVSTAQPETVSP